MEETLGCHRNGSITLMFITFSGCFSSFWFSFISEIKKKKKSEWESKWKWRPIEPTRKPTTYIHTHRKRWWTGENAVRQLGVALWWRWLYNRFINWLGEEKSAANRAVVDVTNWPESPRRASKVMDELRCQVYLGCYRREGRTPAGASSRGALERGVVCVSCCVQSWCSTARLLFCLRMLPRGSARLYTRLNLHHR